MALRDETRRRSPGTYTISGTHTYSSPNDPSNPYDVVVYVDEISNPNNFDSGETQIDTSLPTISVVENGSTKEADGANSMETFTFIRSDLHGALTVPLNIGRTAVEGTNYNFANNSGGGFANDTLTFADVQSSITVQVIPIDDGIAGWTKTVTVTIAQPASGSGSPAPTYQVDPNRGSANGLVGDSDLGVSLDSQTLKANPTGQANLVPLHLDIPAASVSGATIKLSVSDPWEVDVWSSPDGSGPLVLGGGIPSVQWTEAAEIPTTLYVGALTASGAAGDLTFSITDDDTGASPPGITQNYATTSPATAQWSTWNEVAPDILQNAKSASDEDYLIAQTLQPIIASLSQVAANAAFLLGPLQAQNLKNINANTASVLFSPRATIDIATAINTQLLDMVVNANGLVARGASGRFVALTTSMRTTMKWLGPVSLAVPIADWALNTALANIQNIQYVASLVDSVSAGEAGAKNSAVTLLSVYNGAVQDGVQLDNLYASMDGQPCKASLQEINQLRSSVQSHLQQLQQLFAAGNPNWQQLPALVTQANNILQQIVSWITFGP